MAQIQYEYEQNAMKLFATEISKAWISNDSPQIFKDVITYTCPATSINAYMNTYIT